MKTNLFLLALICSIFATQIEAQNRTIINASNSDISDNLDLRAVSSIFGDSRDLQDFERRLNDPNTQISNLDLNNDNRVDYLRVIESVENRIHLIIIQSVLDRDLYQDVATIEVEKDRNNEVHIQVVGNTYMYGPNYIYEPIYYRTPIIYAAFWTSFYRPYYSTWSWNYYPSYYYAWNPYSVFRYRSNVNICLNTYNRYNYVNNRRSTYAVNLYNSRRSSAYERQYPNNSFSNRNSGVNNRYDLDQRRNTRYSNPESRNAYSQRYSSFENKGNQRDYSQNSGNTQRTNTPQSNGSQRNYSQNRVESSRTTTPQSNSSQRDYAQNRVESTRTTTPQSNSNQREYAPNRVESSRSSAPQSNGSQRDYSQNRVESSRTAAPQSSGNQREYSQSRSESQRTAAPQSSGNERSSASNSSNRRS